MVAAGMGRVRELWEHPDRVTASDVPLLELLVAEFPASVPMWWLYVRAVQVADLPQFAKVLHRCANISPDRMALMAWVEAPLVPVQPKIHLEPSQVAAEHRAPALPQTGEPPTNPSAEPAPPERQVRPIPVQAPQPATINLDALPERVREQILRARALKAKLTGGPTPVVEPAPVTAEWPNQQLEPIQPAAPEARRGPEPKKATKPKVRAAVAPNPTQATAPIGSKIELMNLSPFARYLARMADWGDARPQSDKLIDQFLLANPRISPAAKAGAMTEVRTEPDAQVTALVTETLARMYAEQGHIAKAIQAYEILKLRVPDKSTIFAARIEALRTT